MEEKRKQIREYRFSSEWVNYLLFLTALALIYIYLSHRTDNIVRDIDKSRKNLVELRAENITLKSEIIKESSRSNIQERLKEKGIKEPNRPIIKLRKRDE